MKTYWWRFALGLTMLAAGCGKSDTGSTADGKATPGNTTPGQATAGPAPVAGAPASNPNSGSFEASPPDRYAQDLVTSVVSGDVGRIWTALPPKYQADVQGLIGEAAANLDAEVYDKTFAVAGKLTQVLKTKKEFVLNCEVVNVMAPPGTKDIAAIFWTPIVAALETVVYSDVKTHDGLAHCDPGRLLASTGGELYRLARTSIPGAGERLRKAMDSKVAVVKQNGDEATLEITTEGDSPDKLEITRVDGKWLPSFIVRGWEQQISAWRSDLGSLKLTPEVKSKLLGSLAAADASLDKLLTTTDQKAFDLELGRLLNAVPVLMPVSSELSGPPQGAAGSTPPTLTGSRPGGTITPGVPAGSPADPFNPRATPALPGGNPAGLPAFPPGVTPGAGAGVPATPPGLTSPQ